MTIKSTFKRGQAVVAEGYAYTVLDYVETRNEYRLLEIGTDHEFYISADADIKVAP